MNAFSRYRTVILIGILVIGGFFAYTYFFTGAPQKALSVTSSAGVNSTVDQDLIALLTTLKSIKLESGIFSDQSFRSLQDYSQTLVPEPVGRTNPFAPLGNVTPAGTPKK